MTILSALIDLITFVGNFKHVFNHNINKLLSGPVINISMCTYSKISLERETDATVGDQCTLK